MENTKICAARAVLAYIQINRSKGFYADEFRVSHDNIWIHWRSGRQIITQTIVNDAKAVMASARVDIKMFKPATIRHAAISMWMRMGETRETVAARTGHRCLNVISFYYDKSTERDISAELESRLVRTASAGDDEESEEEFEENNNLSVQIEETLSSPVVIGMECHDSVM